MSLIGCALCLTYIMYIVSYVHCVLCTVHTWLAGMSTEAAVRQMTQMRAKTSTGNEGAGGGYSKAPYKPLVHFTAPQTIPAAGRTVQGGALGFRVSHVLPWLELKVTHLLRLRKPFGLPSLNGELANKAVAI